MPSRNSGVPVALIIQAETSAEARTSASSIQITAASGGGTMKSRKARGKAAAPSIGADEQEAAGDGHRQVGECRQGQAVVDGYRSIQGDARREGARPAPHARTAPTPRPRPAAGGADPLVNNM